MYERAKTAGASLDKHITTLVWEMRAKLHSAACIQCKAQDERQNTVLLKVGADRVVLREVGGGERLAYQLTIPATLVQLAVGADHSMLELSAPASLAGRLPVARYHC